MRVDFTGFERVYAETSNRVLVLILARLENHDPIYFFKVGQMSNSYRMAASLTGAGALTPVSNVPGGTMPTGGGTPIATFESDPSFTFIPVNDDTNAQLLLKPIPAETFYILYQQGWRVDQLFRLMVDRIELTTARANGCSVEVIRNMPPPVHTRPDGTAYIDTMRDAQALSHYAAFLRISAVVYELQKRGFLLLRGRTTFRPYDPDSGVAANDSATPGGGVMKPDPAAPGVKDLSDAAAKGATWEHMGNRWFYGQRVFTPVLSLNDPMQPENEHVNIDQLSQEIQMDLPQLQSGQALENILRVLSGTFSIEDSSSTQENNAGCARAKKGSVEIHSHLVMRSMISMMASVAQEQALFDELIKEDLPIPPDPQNVQETKNWNNPSFKEAVPKIEQIPLLRLRQTSNVCMTPALVQLSYAGKTYQVADESAPADLDNQYWNRDMFRLVAELTAQVSVDISKFPLPDILQLHTTN